MRTRSFFPFLVPLAVVTGCSSSAAQRIAAQDAATGPSADAAASSDASASSTETDEGGPSAPPMQEPHWTPPRSTRAPEGVAPTEAATARSATAATMGARRVLS